MFEHLVCGSTHWSVAQLRSVATHHQRQHSSGAPRNRRGTRNVPWNWYQWPSSPWSARRDTQSRRPASSHTSTWCTSKRIETEDYRIGKPLGPLSCWEYLPGFWSCSVWGRSGQAYKRRWSRPRCQSEHKVNMILPFVRYSTQFFK